MRLSWIMCAVLVGCGGEIAQPDAAGVDAGGVANDGGRLCARASECDDGLYCNGVESCVDTLCVAGAPPCDPVAQRCDEAGARCNAIACTPEEADMDEDNHRSNACGGDDCDDDDGNRYTGNHEVCDTAGHDEDCDPDTFGFRDLDMDGEPDAACCNGDVCGSDCDDSRPNVSPRVPEVCGNGLDDDCDGTVDEGAIDGFADPDGDGYGDDSMPLTVCPGTAGFATVGGDCDEGEYGINPGAPEVCNHSDEDCDGLLDEGAGASACSAGGPPDPCTRPYTCLGQCGSGRSGYIRMGGTSSTPNTPPGLAYFFSTHSSAAVDLGGTTTVTGQWDVEYLRTPTSSEAPAFISVIASPRPEVGPDEPPTSWWLPGGAPTLVGPEVAIVASGNLQSGNAVLTIWGPEVAQRLRVSTDVLPAACLPNATTLKRYRVELVIDGSEITATLVATACSASVSVTIDYAGFETYLYGLGPDHPRFWLGALADSDDGGAVIDFRRLDVSRDGAGADQPMCVGCPWVSACMAGP